MQRHRLLLRRRQKVDMPGDIARRHLIANFRAGLEDSLFGGDYIGPGSAHFKIGLLRRPARRRPLAYHSPEPQHPHQSLPAQVQRGTRDHAATGHFGAHAGQTGGQGCRHAQAAISQVVHHHAHGSVKCTGRVQATLELRLIGARDDDGAGHDIQRRAARMQAQQRVGARQQLVVDERRDLLGERTGVVAWKNPIHVLAVDG
ncbi:hypothetical protein D3C86_1366580 [compost metagenome]